ncbi:hypothetical protein B1812_09095 [Methylocystis bryophila]|uniref:Uncharacterized protein n=2 Tax=Methylocystis bryophila TaxID=655015 RepID=A0A1W6MUD6_9HYPH|nr:hypothetical protein B1812_09095 [Methylocystis bryophila]
MLQHFDLARFLIARTIPFERETRSPRNNRAPRSVIPPVKERAMNQTTSTGNEGEGNQTDAKRFNEEQAKALEGPEREALEKAEAEGRSHAKK